MTQFVVVYRCNLPPLSEVASTVQCTGGAGWGGWLDMGQLRYLGGLGFPYRYWFFALVCCDCRDTFVELDSHFTNGEYI